MTLTRTNKYHLIRHVLMYVESNYSINIGAAVATEETLHESQARSLPANIRRQLWQ